MSQKTGAYRNLWALTVLCLLRQGPMHPYEMQRLIRQRKNDEFLDLKRGSLYHAIERLQRAGLIESVETTRQGRRPERTVFRLTREGEQERGAWLRELLANPVNAPSRFFAAISFLVHLPPVDVLEHIEARAGRLETEIAASAAVLKEMVPRIGRLVLLETEYASAIKKAELAWVRSLIDDIKSAKLAWDSDAIFVALGATRTGPDSTVSPIGRKRKTVPK